MVIELSGVQFGLKLHDLKFNRPRSLYQYSNMVPRLSDQTSIFGFGFLCIQVCFGN